MKLQYWIAEHRHAGTHWTLRAASLEKLEDMLDKLDRRNYLDPLLVSVEFSDTLDLIEQCLDEDGPVWEYINLLEGK